MKEISKIDYHKAFVYAVDRCLDPNQYAGPWFEGSQEKFEEWAGDVLLEFLDYFLESLGFKVENEET